MKKPQLPFVSTAEFRALSQQGRLARVRRQFTTQVAKEGEGLSFVMSTPDVDRMSDIIEQDGWNVSDYEKNPVLLWAHDYGQPPVGKVGAVVLEGGLLKARGVEFPERDTYEFGWTVGQLYAKGFMRAVSVGFQPDEFDHDAETGGMRFKKQTLLELSAVPVPANPNALMEAKSAGIDLRTVNEWATRWLDVNAKSLPAVAVEQVVDVWKATKSAKRATKESLMDPEKPTQAAQPPEGDEKEVEDMEMEEKDEMMDEALVEAFTQLSAHLSANHQAMAELTAAIKLLSAAMKPQGEDEEDGMGRDEEALTTAAPDAQDANKPVTQAVDFHHLFQKHFKR